MLMTILGILALTGVGLFWSYVIIIGARDGIIRQQISIMVTTDQDRVLKGLQAKLWGWVLVIAGTFAVILVLWGLRQVLGRYLDFV